MPETQTSLPMAFSDLEPFVALWARATMSARVAQRLASTVEERQSFFAALAPRLPEAFEYLNGFNLEAMPGEAECLLQLCLSMAEVTLAEEINGASESAHAHYSRAVRVTKEFDGR